MPDSGFTREKVPPIPCKKNLQKGERMKDDNSFKLSKLVDQLSHELRTPLNAILGYSELLEKSENLDLTEKKHLENIAESGTKLLDVINDIIEISNIESGKSEVESKCINTRELIGELETKFGSAARFKGLALNISLHDNAKTPFNGDLKKIKSILNSLVSNAVKFTNKGNVDVEISFSNGEKSGNKFLNIQVCDTGLGISSEDIKHIYKPFYQVSSNMEGGTGLGLTTTKKLLNILNGDIQINSKPGIGTKVSVKIPVKHSYDSNKPEVNTKNPDTNYETVKGLRALIVDDLPLNRTLARIMLEMKEFETIEAENGKEAVDCFSEITPDVILMDISMPVMDGIEAMVKIRELNHKHGKEIPIIAITAGGHTGSRNDLIQKGFSEYIQKPYRERELFEKISLFLPVKTTNGNRPVSNRQASLRV